jgi:Zn-dependent protease with chaperone function
VAVYLVAAGALAAGVLVSAWHFPGAGLLPGVVLLAFGVLVLPRPPALPRYATRFDRRTAPALFGFVDRVAEAAGAPAPGIVVVDDRWTFDAGVTGLWRRRYLRLGAPLLAALGAQERAALVAHQLGHFRDGDPLRGPLTGAVDGSLAALVTLFEPRPDTALRAWQSEAILKSTVSTGGTAAGPPSPVVSSVWYAEMLIRPVFAALRWLAVLGRFAFVASARTDRHRAAYWADALAARVAGTPAALAALELLTLREPAVTVVRSEVRAARSDRPDPAAWRTLARHVREHHAPAGDPAREASPFADHPPIEYRLRLLRDAPEQPAEVRFDEDDCTAVDTELTAEYRRFARDLRFG